MIARTTFHLLRVAGILAAFAAASTAQAPTSPVDPTRAAIERWVEARNVIGKEKRDWQLGRELLEARIDLVHREILAVRSRITEAEKNTAEADRKLEELSADNRRLVEAAGGLESLIAQLETRTRKLLPRLPEPLRERVKMLSQRIPEEGAPTRQSLGERFLNVVGVLNEVNKFQREITVTSEVRALGDGTSAEVTTVYIGIGQAYYATGNGKAAGFGAATADDWQWTPANGLAPQILKVIAILKNEAPAEFVPLPAKVQ
jgi:hypothetical protein